MSTYKKLSLFLALAAVIVGLLQWRCPAGSPPVVIVPSPPTEPSPEEPPNTTGLTPPPVTAPIPPPEVPTEFTLQDGEQKVLLSGQASVGIRFNQIGEEQFLTLRINSSEGSENHAILGTGGRFRFQQGGAEYYVTVLRFDPTARTAALRVDRVAQDG